MTEKNIEYIWKKMNKRKLWLKEKKGKNKHRRASLAIFSQKNVKKAQNKEHFQNDF